MSQTVTRVSYEWDLESFDEYGDIIDHDFSEVYPGLPKEEGVNLVLVRNVYEGLSGDDFNYSATLVDRSWAYVVEGVLPEKFDDGESVPKRFFKGVFK